MSELRDAILNGEFSEAEVRAIKECFKSWDYLREAFRYPPRPEEEERSGISGDYLLEMAEMTDVLRPKLITSHRPILGPWIVATKRMLLFIFRPLLKRIFARQILFNSYAWRFAYLSFNLEARVAALEAKLEKIEARME